MKTNPVMRRAWLMALTVAAVAGSLGAEGDAYRGGIAYIYNRCADCHGQQGEGNRERGAPTIAGQEAWYIVTQLKNFRSGIRGADAADGAGKIMAPVAKSLRDDTVIENLAAHLAALDISPTHGLSKGIARRGRIPYRDLCAPCHGPKGEGIVDLKSPRLTGLNDWYVFLQLKKFKAGQRGAHPDDLPGQQMRAIAEQVPDTAAMRDLAAYIAQMK